MTEHSLGESSALWGLEAELSEWILKGVLTELRNIPRTARLESSVVTWQCSAQNSHVRDSKIKFEEEDHRYFLNTGTNSTTVFPISVSGLWARYFEAFDAGRVIEQNYEKWSRNCDSPYHSIIEHGCCCGATRTQIAETIRKGWLDKGELAKAQGTRMHRNIELALGGELHDDRALDMCMFHDFVHNLLEVHKMKVYRLEWSIYDEKAMVAGQIDAIFESNGEFHMIDWKRCEKVLDPTDGAFFQRYGKYPFDDCLDNPCSHYFVQQNLYAVILQRRYDMYLKSMHLVQIHPALGKTIVVEVPDMRDRAGLVLDAYATSKSSCSL